MPFRLISSPNSQRASYSRNPVGLINADLSVALRREPAGEWVLIDAETNLEPDGSALCTAVLSDERGRLGVSTQSLLGLAF